jgi:hypothetical protein
MTVKTHNSDAKLQRKDLNEEAVYLEERIKQMGFEGDCAYERAMYTFYLDRLCELRSQMNVN